MEGLCQWLALYNLRKRLPYSTMQRVSALVSCTIIIEPFEYQQ